MAAAPAAMAPDNWSEVAPLAGVEGAEVAELSMPEITPVALTKGVEELGIRVREAALEETGVLVDMTGVQVDEGVGIEVGVGVEVGVDDGGVYPEGTRVRVWVLAGAEAASAAKATGAIADRKTRALVKCIVGMCCYDVDTVYLDQRNQKKKRVNGAGKECDSPCLEEKSDTVYTGSWDEEEVRK